MYILQYVCPSLLQQQSKLAQIDELIKMFNSETGKKEKNRSVFIYKEFCLRTINVDEH